MKIHQLHYLAEIARHGLSFSGAASALHTSQPGISKQIRLLEEELGIDLFIRNGNRIISMTEPGLRIVAIANLVLRELDNVKSAAREFTEGDIGQLNVASTFTFARYKLPQVLRRFVSRYPRVEIKLLQGSPVQVLRLVAAGEADLALTTPPAEEFSDVLFLEYCKLPRVLVAPREHPLVKQKRITLKTISSYPLITLDIGSHGQSKMRDLFARSGLEPHIVFSGVDVDVVKAFVEAGLGVAVLPRIAYEPEREPKLRAVDVSHLFESHSGCLALRKNHYPRGFVYAFIEMLTSGMDRRAVQRALDDARSASV
jgi:LysR family transcriptional regulator, cys regulon transcriptional activator